MKRYWKLVALPLLLGLLWMPDRSVSADGGEFDGQIILGQSFTLKSGETLDGDLAIIGGTVTIEQNARVQGDIALIGGSLQIDGEVQGNVAVIGGIVNLSDSAWVGGDIALVGGSVQRAQGARVAGRILETTLTTFGWNAQNLPTTPAPPESPRPWSFPLWPLHLSRIALNWWHGVPEAFSQSVGLALLAMLLMLFLAQPAERIARTLLAQPILTGGIGLLTAFVTPLLVLIMVMTILLIPLIPVLVLGLAAAALFGWIALGYEVGQRLVQAFKGNWHPSFAAGLGTFLLTISIFALLNFPGLNCISWIVPVILLSAAIGSVVITAFGSRLPATLSQPPALPPEAPLT